ncbi:hypothetical protein ZIOFF_041869 [Zingiber officinale]|uniref:Uncharacterized protein n=1 Tax=Zingiber officinale TaxID=94328 RepID=A0A8J5GE93_ZINOF|nr:hypothetical protein ZIOFF_041869 [Zingiber officinale]
MGKAMIPCRITGKDESLHFIAVPLIIFLITSALLPPAIGAAIGNRPLDPNKPVCHSKNGKPYNCVTPPSSGPPRNCDNKIYRCPPPP